MSRWDSSALRRGSLRTQRIAENTYRLQGTTHLSEGDRSYEARLHGRAVYNEKTKRFTPFEAVAVGQRTGKGGTNGRENDLGPAPMGVAFKLFQTTPK